MIKILTILLSLIVYMIFFVFSTYNTNIEIQLVVFLFFLIVNTLVNDIRNTYNTVLRLLPFVAFLFLFGAIFQLLHLLGRNDWMNDTTIKMLLFPNSLFVCKIAVELITLNDIYNLPISINTKSYIITIKAVLIKGKYTMNRFRFLLDTYKYLQKSKFKKNGSLILALFFYLEQESQNQWLVFDNRIRHLTNNKENKK